MAVFITRGANKSRPWRPKTTMDYRMQQNSMMPRMHAYRSTIDPWRSFP
jgi:hypothetical protein